MKKVFLVEDSPVVRESYELLFEVTPGFEISGQAGSAEEALDALETTPADVVVVDVSLPGMSGIDMVRMLARKRPGLPSVMITGHDREVYAAEAMAAGARGYAMKHEGPQALLKLLRSLFEGV